MRAICKHLGLTLQRERYLADNFDGIFDGLEKRTYDAVISGTTITPDRSADCAVFEALPGIQSGSRGQSAADAESHLGRGPARA